MEAITRCPETCDLYAYLDGELDSRMFTEVDRHLLDCSRCRDEVRRLKVFQRTLFSRISPDISIDADQTVSVADFKRKLMGRMATSDEVRGREPAASSRSRVGVMLGVAGALVVIVAASVVGFDRTSAHSSAPTIVASKIDGEVDKEIRKLSLLRLESDFRTGIAEGSWQSVGALRDFSRKFEATGGSIIPVLERISRAGTLVERRWIAARLATEIGEDASHVARMLAVDSDIDVRHNVVADAWRWPRETALSLVVAAGSDVPRRTAVATLQKIKSNSATRQLIAMAMNDDADEVVAALSAGPDADAVLLEAYMRGSQSSLLRRRLLKSANMVVTAKKLAESSAESVDRRCRAMLLLGDLRDRTSVALFDRRLGDRAFAAAAAAALARLDDDDARLVLARRLSPNSFDRDDDIVQASITRAIRSMDERASAFFLERIACEDGQFSANYVVAAGLCGSERTIPALVRYLDDDMLTLHAVRAIDAIDDRASTAVLVKLTRSNDGRVRDEARSALRRRGAAEGSGRTRPLVDVPQTLAPDPSLVEAISRRGSGASRDT